MPPPSAQADGLFLQPKRTGVRISLVAGTAANSPVPRKLNPTEARLAWTLPISLCCRRLPSPSWLSKTMT